MTTMRHNLREYLKKELWVVFVLLISIVLVLSGIFVPDRAFGDTSQEACIGGTPHNFEVTVQKYAMENEEGVRLFSCKRCSYSYEQIIPATGHVWGEWVIETEPTCETEGHEHRVCQKYPDNPHYENRTLSKLSDSGEHSYTVVDQTESTCTERGSQLLRCSVCGQTTTEETAPLGHEWGEWYTEVDPQIGQAGKSRRTCSRDASHIEYKSISPLLSQEEKPSASLGSDSETPLSFFTFVPNDVDKALWSIDLLAILLFIFLALPFIFQVTWIKKKRREAYEKARLQAQEERKRNKE